LNTLQNYDDRAARRARPRCFTSPASSRVDCDVIVRPSPRAREASAVSTAARISARVRSRCSHMDNASCTASSARWNRPVAVAWRTNASWSGVKCTSMPSSVGVRKGGVKHCFRLVVGQPLALQKIPSFSKSLTTTLTTASIAFFAELGLKESLIPVQTSSPSGAAVAYRLVSMRTVWSSRR
jgi:hypothetical protein